jgi:hypothetical protein
MGDDRTDRRPQDRSRISLGEGYEATYWTKALGVSEDRLRDIVSRVGNSGRCPRGAR